MRYTTKVSVWPVGLVGAMKFEQPVVENGKVVRFHTGWRPNRPFPIDMAGFAVSLNLVLANLEAHFDGNAEMGFLESSFLQNLVTMEELEPKADMCNKVDFHWIITPVNLWTARWRVFIVLCNYKNVFKICVCVFCFAVSGTGVAHAHWKAKDEKGGGSYKAGVRIRSQCGSVSSQNTPRTPWYTPVTKTHFDTTWERSSFFSMWGPLTVVQESRHCMNNCIVIMTGCIYFCAWMSEVFYFYVCLSVMVLCRTHVDAQCFCLMPVNVWLVQ